LLQGVGAALGVSVTSAAFTEAYRGKIVAGQALSVVTTIALSVGPVLTAVAYDLGAGTRLSYLPIFVLGAASLALLPLFDTRSDFARETVASEETLPKTVVSCGLRFAMPMVFVAWAGNSLYLSLVPAYLAAALHASDPLVGAGALVADQVATAVASIRFGTISPERSGVIAPFFVVLGLALLVTGTQANSWWLIGVATILVGAGGGVAAGASFAIVARVGRGQRARIFARLLVAAYLGYSLPALLTGVIASRTSFMLGFASVVVGLAFIAAALPVLRWRSHVALHAAATASAQA
jgi:hypothetical protein